MSSSSGKFIIYVTVMAYCLVLLLNAIHVLIIAFRFISCQSPKFPNGSNEYLRKLHRRLPIRWCQFPRSVPDGDWTWQRRFLLVAKWWRCLLWAAGDVASAAAAALYWGKNPQCRETFDELSSNKTQRLTTSVKQGFYCVSFRMRLWFKSTRI